MAGKAKPTKHTAKEIAMKNHESKMKKGLRGGGLEGQQKRTAPKEGKKDIFLKCEVCFTMQPSLKSMQIHYENKHAKVDWNKVVSSYSKEEEVEEKKEEVTYKSYYNYQEYASEEEKEVDN